MNVLFVKGIMIKKRENSTEMLTLFIQIRFKKEPSNKQHVNGPILGIFSLSTMIFMKRCAQREII